MKRPWFALLVALCAATSLAAGVGSPAITSSGAGNPQVDINAPWTPGPWMPPADDTLEYFGNTSQQYGPGGARQRGNIYRFDVPNTRILEIRQYFNPTATGTMCFMVYESAAESVGTYNLVDSASITCGTGAGWYSSGPRDFLTTPGKYYAIVTGWVPTAYYYANLAVAPWPFPSSFGAQIGQVGLAAGWTWTYPPPATQTTTSAMFTSTGAYYQALLTNSYTPTPGDLALQSIDEPSGPFIEPGLPFTPAATAHNPGTTAVSNFQVVFSVDDGVTKALVYQDTVDVAGPLEPDSSVQVTFADFTPLDLTNYYVTAYVVASGDPNQANDTLHSYFRTFNELVGNVSDDNNGGAPLAGVAIEAVGPATYTTTTDGDGNYFFFDMTAGTYDVTAELAGYIDEEVTGVTITDFAQTTLDLSMGYPVLALSPTDSVYVSLPWGGADSTTWQFTVENTGARDMSYNVYWPESTLTKGAKAPVSLVLDDGTVDNNIGIGGTLEFIWANRFTPAGGEFPFQLQQVQAWFSATGLVNVGDDIQIAIYENTTGGNDPAVGSNWLYSYATTVQAVDAWNVYDLPEPVLLNGPGDVVIGIIGLEVPGTSYWPAAIDQTATQQRSWAGWWLASPPPTPPTLPPDDTWILIDDYFPGNWMLRGYGETGGNNAVWLNITPASGTVSAYGTENLAVKFDAAGLDSFTDWAANVRFHTNAAADQFVPAWMHVLGLTGVSGGPTQPLSYAFGLNANRPNPVNGRTTFSFTLPKAQDYALRVYNIAGQAVASFTGRGQAGPNSVAWNTGRNGAGVYFYQLASGGLSATRKLVVLK